MEVRQDNLFELPYIVDYVLEKNIELWLHFDKKKFSKQTIKDIYYCARYKNIHVIALRYSYETGNCRVPLNSKSSFELSLKYAKAISFIKQLQTRFSIG